MLHEIPRVLIRELPRGRPLGIVEGIVKGTVEKDKLTHSGIMQVSPLEKRKLSCSATQI